MYDKPIMCTLSEGDFEIREAAWRAVLAGAVKECRETPEGFVLSIARDAAILAEIQRLATLESSCCAWMEIAVDDSDPIVLTMASKARGGKDVIAMLVRSAASPT